VIIEKQSFSITQPQFLLIIYIIIMNSQTAKEKYFKYKTKYMQLKEQLGGLCATCPKRGFKQHFSECWHDCITMGLLYSDNLSEHTQEIFTKDFDVDDCIKYAKENSPRYLLPVNIETDVDYKIFINASREYLINLHKNYINEQKDIYIPFAKPPKDSRLRSPTIPIINKN
jgi:hypothetical protein